MEKKGQSHGSRREENEGRDTEFTGDIKGIGAKEVNDDGGDVMSGGEGVKGGPEGVKGANNGEGDDGFDFNGAVVGEVR